MAGCCGCGSGRCTCAVVAGPGIEITGNGGSASPYVISATGGGGGDPTAVQVTDTPTVDMSLSGTGAPGDPYDVSADVIVDPAPPGGGANLLHADADGLYVECADVRGCLGAGDGITYDPATGEIEALPSTDPGNTLTFGTDGGLMVPPGGSTALQVTDTPTVDLTLTGTGVPGDPYDVAAAVRVDPAPPAGANLIQETPDGLYVDCGGVRSCLTGGSGIDYDQVTGEISVEVSAQAGNQLAVEPDGLYVPPSAGGVTELQVTDTPSVDLTLTGTGAVGDPFDVSAAVRLDATPPGGGANLIESGPDGLYVECADVRTCFTGGDGIDYDPATGEIAAQLSTDADNQVVFGTDGGIYVPPGGGAVTVGDTDCITMAGDGSPGQPITAEPRLDPAANNLLACAPEGLRATLAAGCGLLGDGSAGAPLTAATYVWPYGCDLDANAGLVYCDSGGGLRSEPLVYAQFTQDHQPVLYPSTAVPSGFDNVIETRNLVVNNPDPCRPAFVIMEAELDVDFDLPPGAGAACGITTDEMVYHRNTGSSTELDFHVQTTKVYNRVIPAGGALNEPFDITMGRGVGGATFNRIQTFMRAFVFVLHV